MNERNQFNSILAPFMQGLLEEKRSLGFLYDTEELILARFDRYCVENKVGTQGVTRDLLCRAGRSFDSKGDQVMSHGSITIDEVIVPFITIKAGDNNG